MLLMSQRSPKMVKYPRSLTAPPFGRHKNNSSTVDVRQRISTSQFIDSYLAIWITFQKQRLPISFSLPHIPLPHNHLPPDSRLRANRISGQTALNGPLWCPLDPPPSQPFDPFASKGPAAPAMSSPASSCVQEREDVCGR